MGCVVNFEAVFLFAQSGAQALVTLSSSSSYRAVGNGAASLAGDDKDLPLLLDTLLLSDEIVNQPTASCSEQPACNEQGRYYSNATVGGTVLFSHPILLRISAQARSIHGLMAILNKCLLCDKKAANIHAEPKVPLLYNSKTSKKYKESWQVESSSFLYL
jgi:hypothetical protein